jgi:hypothetical protein
MVRKKKRKSSNMEMRLMSTPRAQNPTFLMTLTLFQSDCFIYDQMVREAGGVRH